MLRFQLTDQAARLLYQLDIVLRLKTVIAGQQAIYLVYENDRRTVLFRSGKQFREFLDRCARSAAQDVGGRDRVEAPFGLRRNQPSDRRLAGSRGPDQQQAGRHGQLEALSVRRVHQAAQVPEICLCIRRQNDISPVHFLQCRAVLATRLREGSRQVALFDTSMLFGSKEGGAIHERANLGRAPAGCLLRERLETKLSRWPPCQLCVKDPSPLSFVW